MRAFVSLLVVGLLVGGTSTARAQEEVKAVIDKAIKAHGGEAKLAKHQAGQTRAKGTLEVMGLTLEFTQQASWQMPNLIKEEMELDIMGNKVKVTTVFNGEKGWMNINGQTQQLEGVLLNEVKEGANFIRMSRFTPLKDDKLYQLASLGEIKVDGKPAIGIKASSKAHRDANLYFDKASGLLVKVERRAVDPMTQQELNEERIITEYQEIDGAKVAKKVVIHRDGKKFMELEVLEVKTMEKLDPSTFAMP